MTVLSKILKPCVPCKGKRCQEEVSGSPETDTDEGVQKTRVEKSEFNAGRMHKSLQAMQ